MPPIVPNQLELFAFVVFIAVVVYVSVQVYNTQGAAFIEMQKYCDQKYGANHWILQNGGGDCGSMLHDCIECVNKTEGKDEMQ